MPLFAWGYSIVVEQLNGVCAARRFHVDDALVARASEVEGEVALGFFVRTVAEHVDLREEGGGRRYHRINLNDAAALSSPYFYLQQNDVVYVEPNQIRQDNSKYNQNNAYKLSVISTIVSACSVVASLIIALAIK